MEQNNSNKFSAMPPSGVILAYSDVDSSELMVNDIWYN